MVHFGPAGWLYKDWEGVVYPAPKPKGFDPLAYIARYFSTVEINSTYYGSPLPATADKWVERVKPFPDFRFTAKLWKRFTHERKTAWTRAEVKEACVPMDRLLRAGKLGALLMQFPWSFRRTDENREWLDDLSRTFRRFPLVLEVRHESWNTPEFYAELAERGIGFVNIDQPLFKKSIKPSATVTSPVGYIRVHGRNTRTGSGRTPASKRATIISTRKKSSSRGPSAQRKSHQILTMLMSSPIITTREKQLPMQRC